MADFLAIENPYDGLRLMRGIEEKVMNLHDSTIANFYINVAVCYGQLGISDSSFYFLDLGEQLAMSINNDLSLIKVNNTRGLVYMSMGQFEESLSAYQRGLEIAEQTDGPKILESRRKIYGNMGGIYYQLKDFEKAAEVTLRALQLSELQEDLSSIAYNNLRLALIYGDLENIDKCISHLETARDGLNALGDTATLIYAENTWGKILENQNQPGQALAHFNRALELSREVDNSAELVYMLNSAANINFKLGNLRLADQLARAAFTDATANGINGDVVFEIVDGYDVTERVSTAGWTGNDTYTITVRPQNNATSIYLRNANNVMRISGSSNLIIDGADPISGNNVINLVGYIWMRNGAHDVEIKNLNIDAYAFTGINMFNDISSNPACYDITIEGNEIFSSYEVSNFKGIDIGYSDATNIRVIGNLIHITETTSTGAAIGVVGRSVNAVTKGAYELPNNIADIIGFTLAEQHENEVIDNVANTIFVEVAEGTNLMDLTPTITPFPGASTNPASGVNRNFSSPQSYTVTAEDLTADDNVTYGGVYEKALTITINDISEAPGRGYFFQL
ncbi:Ttc28 [Symbiodinium microadriaticum]|nr:Ttc28 [Symbiodinium microadriaticum]